MLTDMNITSSAEPDPDTIKMFVGQIPRYMNENDLQKLFDEFGPVYQLNILRDKPTGQSKGCCFVTFYSRRSALEAQNALHNMKTLPGMQHPIQMKPADSEKRVEERKLFIGMLSKKCTETDVRLMFSTFGHIEECTVLREQNGLSRGCAFVTFTSRQCAQNAIRSLHHSKTMEGCRSPLVVKLADSHQEKEMKRLQQMHAQLINGSSFNSLGSQYLALLQQTLGSSLGNMNNSSVSMQMQQLLNSTQLNQQQQQQSFNSSQSTLQNETNSGFSNLAALAALNNKLSASGGLNSGILQHINAVNSTFNANSNSILTTGSNSLSPGQTGINLHQALNPLSSMSSLTNSLPLIPPLDLNNKQQSNSLLNNDSTFNSAYSSMQFPGLSGLLNQSALTNALLNQGLQQQNQQQQLQNQQQHSSSSLSTQFSLSPTSLFNSTVAGKQTEGPDGANLFIYHLPQECGDVELMQMFLPFGEVISAKVYIDKQTNLSKCFGFVSYNAPSAAQQAIQAMNGYQIGVKRLKVQLKRPKTDIRLY